MTIPTSPSPDWVLRNRAISERMLGPAGEHEHVWGPLSHSHFGGNVHRKCTVDGCEWINALDDPDEFCHECGKQFAVDDSGVSNHLKEGGGIDHDADADHVPFSLPDEEE